MWFYILLIFNQRRSSLTTVDLEPLFNWNVKQLFLYLTAEYETKDHVSIQLSYVGLYMTIKK